jgi:thiol-disulfide isomerase/thioredoxin
MNKCSAVTVLSMAFLSSLQMARAAELKVGDKAPVIKIEKWINHAPPALPGAARADKHIFLVEFWATWCPPCKRSIPHLAQLHEKHKEDGLVILGISNEEEKTVADFVDKKMKMPYYVGIDDEMATNTNWMEGIEGIPHAFLVDKTGTIVWADNPLNTPSLDSTIEKVLAGKFDVQTAKNEAATNEKYAALMEQLKTAFGSRDQEKTFQILDQLIALKPAEPQPWLIKRQLLGDFKMAEKIPALDEQMEAALKDAPEALAQLVATELARELKDRDPVRMLRLARRAVEASENEDPQILALLARVQCELGQIDAAIQTQEKAIGAAAGNADTADEMKQVLKYFQSAKRAATQGAKDGVSARM